MDQKLLLKEKDYELIATKRTLVPKHSFYDPLINPPKLKPKKNKHNQSQHLNKPSPILSNNILERRTTKPVKSIALMESKMQG